MSGKRILAFFLVLCMLAALTPLSASAEEGTAFSVGTGLVSLVFSGDAETDLRGLTLLDATGNVVLPISDAGGSYVLAPGSYSYYYLDPRAAAETVSVIPLAIDGSQPRVEITLVSAPAAAPVAVSDEEAGELPILTDKDTDTDGESGPMPVLFVSDSTQDFSGLTVTDAAGVICSPYTESENGTLQFDRYLLLPGQYSYYYHDPSGKNDDGAGIFTVSNTGMQTVTLTLMAADEGMCFSSTAINPYYANIIREDSIPEPSTSPEESLEQLRREVESLSADPGMSDTYYAGQELILGKESGEPWPTPVVYTNAEAAGAGLKRNLILRQEEIAVCVRTHIKPTTEVWRTMCWMIYDIAIRHTGAPTEGDYLRYEYGGANCNGSAVTAETPGEYYYKFIYSPLYFTTLAQESELNGIVANILDGLQPAGKNDAEKIRAVYEYLTGHVRYTESDDTLIFTAYAALRHGRAACQGIAVAFYRLCLELGVDTRLVTSRGMGHAWNIVRADGRHYYAVDATWDAGKSQEQWLYYLKGSESWLKNHELGDEFTDGKFDAYDFPQADFGGESGVTIHSASVLFDGMLRIRYYFQLPDWLAGARGASVQFSRGGSVIATVPLSQAGQDGGYSVFDCSVSVKNIADPVQVRILDGNGQNVLISTADGKSYPNGVFFSAMEYASQMKTKGTTAAMRGLAQALEDYGLAARNYFDKAGETLRSEVTAVTAGDLSPWTAVTQGVKPQGFRDAAITALFDADNSLRVYLYFEEGANPSDYQYEIDGRAAKLVRKSDGSCCLGVDSIAANDLDVPHRFTVSDGTDSFTITASVLSYAKTAIERGGTDLANLGRALYLFNRAAEKYFGG